MYRSSLLKKRILIVGGTGSVGDIIVNGLIKDGAKRIHILARDETRHQELLDKYSQTGVSIEPYIGDIKDPSSLEKPYKECDIIIHAAAMKHVKYCHKFPEEAYKSNVIGLNNSISLAEKNGVSHFVFISSDKAANPVTYYGKTKYEAENIVRHYHEDRGNKNYVNIRLGNVLGARNSVLPHIKKQIDKQKPVAIAKEHTRFIMQHENVYDLLTTALVNPTGSHTYIWDMPSVRVEDLVTSFIDQYCSMTGIDSRGIQKDVHPPLQYEKKHEALYSNSESLFTVKHGQYYTLGKTQEIKHNTGAKFSNGSALISKHELRELLCPTVNRLVD